MDNWFSIYLWKIPGVFPTTPGPLQFTGPTLKNMFTPAKAGDSIATTSYPFQDVHHLTWTSRQFIGGATGCGIQLACGDAASQGRGTPAKSVLLNTLQGANTINSAYRSTAYLVGDPVIPAGTDGTIKMAARYIRTSGTVQPGTANASIEVIASYQ